MSIATKTMIKFLKSLKKTFFFYFSDDKRTQSLVFAFPLKIEAFSVILPTKFISLNCTASQNS